ncbi:MAG: integration host factor, actinobacterial type [Solirubrobacteraceae bacterium]
MSQTRRIGTRKTPQSSSQSLPDGIARGAEEQPRQAPEGLSRSHLQRMEALARANDIRTQRAKIKRELRAGRLSIDRLLLDPPSCIDTAKVFDLLLAVPRYGRVKVNKILAHCRISPSKTIGGLSERQRAELVMLLRR